MVHYADKDFVSAIDLARIRPAVTHYIGKGGDERITDLVFQCPMKNGKANRLAIIIFEHQSGSLKHIPLKLLKYISAIWDTEAKTGKPLSVPYFTQTPYTLSYKPFHSNRFTLLHCNIEIFGTS